MPEWEPRECECARQEKTVKQQTNKKMQKAGKWSGYLEKVDN